MRNEIALGTPVCWEHELRSTLTADGTVTYEPDQPWPVVFAPVEGIVTGIRRLYDYGANGQRIPGQFRMVYLCVSDIHRAPVKVLPEHLTVRQQEAEGE